MLTQGTEDVKALVDGLNFAEQVDRALGLIREAYEEFFAAAARLGDTVDD